ncbi:hypothetical protein N5P32_01255 [Marinomonas pontica]|uniref:hypothetical protein n=1 Tax=Marinomonas pontica TaxID=264739 RepID=UPI002244228C|nr:hypothetical protein [Marinomonas pontica]MCW8354613.1 hypothetical protein [Marinomonas pontica]
MFESKKLRNKEGIWRVDGISSIKLSEKYIPQVFISISKIKSEGVHSPLKLGQLTREQAWILEPLNRLSEFLIGSCWEYGKRINRPSPFETKYTIDTSKIRILKPNEGITIDGTSFDSILPPMAIDLRFKNIKRIENESFYAIVPVLDDPLTEFLVVPCSELYRFYIGVSDRFTNKVLTNDTQNYFSWEDPYIKIKRPLNRLEQFVAYRGNWDEQGKEWLSMPSNYIKSVQITNATVKDEKKLQPLALKATFPFKGISTLTIAGKRFKYETNDKVIWAIFAANIIHCDKKVDFETKVLADPYSKDPQAWTPEAGDANDLIESPFDDEFDVPETNEPPNTLSGNTVILNSSNRFSAMANMNFKHYRTNETNDPVYVGDSITESNLYSYEDMVTDDSDERKLQKNEFDSHIDHIDRKLSDFIKMIPYLRAKNVERKWEIVTRAADSILEQHGEIVTTFLHNSNRRYSWHLMDYGRLRQIAWVEIIVNQNTFIYLAEMELKGSEPGRSTLCIFKSDFQYMPEQDFKIFLEITARQNRWPRANHKWKSAQAQKKAKKYFEDYTLIAINHPEYLSTSDTLSETELSRWAQNLTSNLRSILRRHCVG